MRSKIPTTDWNLTYLVNLVILGLLINSFYYFGLWGAIITFILILFLAPISNEDIVGIGTAEEN
ncbi:hypothetical protein [Halalkalicoccus salilacus]|uniref:hypothetical protein n=1 Tax=Halalkalicoccus TaxID=332246 RepID=UPI002F9658CE